MALKILKDETGWPIHPWTYTERLIFCEKFISIHCMYGETKRKLRHISNLKLVYLITSFHLQTKIHPLESVALDVNKNICMEVH